MDKENNIYQDYNNLMKRCYALEDEIATLRKALRLVVHRMNSGPNYWGDLFDSKERKEIQNCLKEDY